MTLFSFSLQRGEEEPMEASEAPALHLPIDDNEVAARAPPYDPNTAPTPTAEEGLYARPNTRPHPLLINLSCVYKFNPAAPKFYGVGPTNFLSTYCIRVS